MKVIDNFLPDNVFQQISDNVMGEMPWTFLDTVSKPTEKIKIQNCFHVHQVYENNTPLSQAFGLLTPFFRDKRLNLKSIIRIIFNSYPYTPELFEHKGHVDFDYKHKGAILYLNTCDGYTYAEGKQVKSVANRVLIHDPSKLHHSTTTTDAQRRVVCNLNYFKNEKCYKEI